MICKISLELFDRGKGDAYNSVRNKLTAEGMIVCKRFFTEVQF